MKKLLPLLFAHILIHSKDAIARTHDDTYTVNIAKKDSSVRATVYNEPRKIRTQAALTYYWFAYNHIYFTQGGYDGRLLHGEYVCFYPNGNIKQKGNYENGLKNGEWISWYENGIMSEVSHWKNGTREGEWSRFSNMGDLVLSAHYRHSRLHGDYLQYEEKKLVSRKKYRNGVELPEKKKTVQPLYNTPSRENSNGSGDKRHNKGLMRRFFHHEPKVDPKPKPKEKGGGK
jgi:hypothetical protein